MREELDVITVPFICYVPENTIKVKITATIMDENDKLLEAEMIMRTAEVREGMINGEYWGAENIKYKLADHIGGDDNVDS